MDSRNESNPPATSTQPGRAEVVDQIKQVAAKRRRPLQVAAKRAGGSVAELRRFSVVAGGCFDQTPIVDTVDVEAMRPLLEAKLQPWRMRATLTFVGLYQLTHEEIRRVVLKNVKDFYLRGFDQSGLIYDTTRYKEQVLDRDPKSPLRASLLWLIHMGAITTEQADRLYEITKHRNDLMHELAKYIVDPKFEPDVALFLDALHILRAIHDFWIQIEIDTGWMDEHPGITPAEVMPLSLMVLSMCIEAYADGLRHERETGEPART